MNRAKPLVKLLSSIPYGTFAHLIAPLCGFLPFGPGRMQVWPSNIEPEVVRRLYAAFGLDWTPQLEARFEAHVRENPKGKHGAHDYDLVRYGLGADDVRARYGASAERFGLPID